jgi:hypothetical protein
VQGYKSQFKDLLTPLTYDKVVQNVNANLLITL